jgi:V/A-type H+-transporting ATPase subunit D
MAQITPTKGNLLKLKDSYKLAFIGYDLMNQKKNILIREMMILTKSIRSLRMELETTYKNAYLALQEANITLGIVTEISKTIPIYDGLKITYKSVMGVDIPKISFDDTPIKLTYGMDYTNTKFDYAFYCFQKVRELTIRLAEIDNSACRLANAIRKSQKRANALKNIVIPNLDASIKYIDDILEEKEREEFTRNKIIKKLF